MKRNIKMKMVYDGSSYNGWQRQNNTDKTIQGILEDRISKIIESPIELHGSGRTDSGVHAKGQVANFYVKTSLSLQKMKEMLNNQLPEDIKIVEIEEVDTNFHARKSAIGKLYSYSIWNSDISPVFERKYVYEVPSKLDLEAMKIASLALLGEHDFRSFSSDKNKEKSSVRRIDSITFKKNGDNIVIYFKGSGFLYNMVRIMTGSLIEVGLNKQSEDFIKQAILRKNREAAGFTAPPKGLCLEHVFYEKL